MLYINIYIYIYIYIYCRIKRILQCNQKYSKKILLTDRKTLTGHRLDLCATNNSQERKLMRYGMHGYRLGSRLAEWRSGDTPRDRLTFVCEMNQTAFARVDRLQRNIRKNCRPYR